MERKRLTITIKKELLPEIDKIIDGLRIRNRSHAIEYLLTQTLSPKISKALVLAGGEGIKMRPFTYEIPKTLIPVKDKPILEYIIELLREAQIREIMILVGHLGNKIKSHFGNGSRFGVKISYLLEKKPRGTAAPLRQAKEFIGKSSFVTIYGDTLIDINLRDLIDFHQAHPGIATMALTSYDKPYEFGVVRLHGNKIVKFTEKPEKGKKVSHLINAGLFIFDPEIINYIPKKGYSMLEKDVFPKLVKEGKLYGYPFEGQWFDVSTPEVYEEVLKEWKK